jgi:hypothetical protein
MFSAVAFVVVAVVVVFVVVVVVVVVVARCLQAYVSRVVLKVCSNIVCAFVTPTPPPPIL